MVKTKPDSGRDLGCHWSVTTEPALPYFKVGSGAPFRSFTRLTGMNPRPWYYFSLKHKLPQFHSISTISGVGVTLNPPFYSTSMMFCCFAGVLSSAVDGWMVNWAVEKKRELPWQASSPSVSLTAHSPGGESAALWMKGAAEGRKQNFTKITSDGWRFYIQLRGFDVCNKRHLADKDQENIVSP